MFPALHAFLSICRVRYTLSGWRVYA